MNDRLTPDELANIREWAPTAEDPTTDRLLGHIDALEAQLADAFSMLEEVWPCIVHTEWAVRSETGVVYSVLNEESARATVSLAEALGRPVEVIKREVRETPWTPVDVTSATETGEHASARPLSRDEASEAPTEARTLDDWAESLLCSHTSREEMRAIVRQIAETVRRDLAAAIRTERIARDDNGYRHSAEWRRGMDLAQCIVLDHPSGGAS